MKRIFAYPQEDGTEIHVCVSIFNKITKEAITEDDDRLMLKHSAIGLSVETYRVSREKLEGRNIPL